jgi:FkbM family methyltransferase
MKFDIHNPFIDPRVKQLIDPASIKVIIEAGCRDYENTKQLLQHYPNAHIHSFEPVPVLYDLCSAAREECENKDRSTLVRKSLWSVDTVINLQVPVKESQLGSTSHYSMPHLKTTPIQTEAITIDSYCREHSIVPDAIFLDVEECELHVIKGAVSVLEYVKVIIAEVAMQPRRSREAMRSYITAFLHDHQFIDVLFYAYAKNPTTGRIMFGDCMYLNEKYI